MLLMLILMLKKNKYKETENYANNTKTKAMIFSNKVKQTKH
jgi:hypothetical protein